MQQVKVLAFDTGGTVLDWHAGLTTAMAAWGSARYVWDGRLEAAGFNPYRYPPADTRFETLHDHNIYPRIGSKYAPTIHPPTAEAIFLLVTRVSGS